MQNTTASRATLMTGPGAAAIAVIRLTGPITPAFLQRHLDKPIPIGRAIHAQLHDDGVTLDDPIVFTTPEFTELHVHGGPWIVQSVLELARRFGFEVRAEFAADAQFADGESAIDREIEAWLPLARTELAIATLLAQRSAWQNFSPTRESAAEILQDRSLDYLLNPPKVAIVGPPNAGKSTLANQLFGQAHSIVADLPGTTRDWVGEFANIHGLVICLTDTPGQRDTTDPIESHAIAQSQPEIASADLVVFVTDKTAPLADQLKLLAQYPTAIVLENKSDCPARWDDSLGLPICAASGAGIDTLRARITREFGIAARPQNAPRCWTPRQRELLESVVRD